MNNTNTNNLSGLSLHFPPLHPGATRNTNLFYPNQTCKNYFNNSKILKNKSAKNIDDFSSEKLLLKTGSTSSSKNVHLLSAISVNKNISLLKEDNIRHKSFMQLYSNTFKTKKPHHHPFDLSTHVQAKSIDNHKNNTLQLSCMSTTISMKHKHKKTSSVPHNKKEESDTLSSININDVQHSLQCKEFDMMFANSVKQLQKIKKRKRSHKHFVKNKYTNNTINEINDTHNKLSFLSGIINYIYPKVVLLKTAENTKKLIRNQEKNNLSSLQTCQSFVDSNVSSMALHRKRKCKLKGKMTYKKEFDLNFINVKRDDNYDFQ